MLEELNRPPPTREPGPMCALEPTEQLPEMQAAVGQRMVTRLCLRSREAVQLKEELELRQPPIKLRAWGWELTRLEAELASPRAIEALRNGRRNKKVTLHTLTH